MPKYKFSVSEMERMEANEWLTDRERKAFSLYYKRGWSIENIAAELDITRSTVNRDLANIRKKTLETFF